MKKTFYQYEEYTKFFEPTELISIQIYDGKEWSQTPATFHQIPKGKGGMLSKFLANSLKTQIRMTYPLSPYYDISRLSGCYISWDQFTFSPPSVIAICNVKNHEALTYKRCYDVRPYKYNHEFYTLIDDNGSLNHIPKDFFIKL